MANGHLLRRLQAIASGLPGHYELHKFRKTFAGMYVHRVDIETLRQMLGHTSLDITQDYIACFKAEAKEAQSMAVHVVDAASVQGRSLCTPTGSATAAGEAVSSPPARSHVRIHLRFGRQPTSDAPGR